MEKKGPIEDRFPMAFRVTLAERARAAAGLPPHLLRRRRIEDLEEALAGEAAEILEDAEYHWGPGTSEAEIEFDKRVRDIDLRLVNDLIRRHNEYFPIEANLPIDVATGCLMHVGKKWEPLRAVTHDALILRARRMRSG